MSDRKSPYSSTRHTGLPWRRWEMGAFELPSREPAAPPQDQALDEEHAAHLQQLARQVEARAQKKGHTEGYVQGHEEGLKAGQAQGHEAGHAQGYQEGYQAGLTEGRTHADREAAQLAELVTQCARSLTELETEVGQSLIGLALDIARQVVRSSLEAHPDKVLDIVRDIIHMDATSESMVRLKVHPDDLALIQAHLDAEPAVKQWRLVPDESIERGGCIAETAHGSIDATLRTRWQRVAASLGDTRAWSD